MFDKKGAISLTAAFKYFCTIQWTGWHKQFSCFTLYLTSFNPSDFFMQSNGKSGGKWLSVYKLLQFFVVIHEFENKMVSPVKILKRTKFLRKSWIKPPTLTFRNRTDANPHGIFFLFVRSYSLLLYESMKDSVQFRMRAL